MLSNTHLHDCVQDRLISADASCVTQMTSNQKAAGHLHCCIVAKRAATNVCMNACMIAGLEKVAGWMVQVLGDQEAVAQQHEDLG
jgi:hypothetical protein